MTILDVCKAVASVVGLDLPTAVFGSRSRTGIELGYLANECASSIVDEADWRGLSRQFTLTGDGANAALSLPADFARFRVDAQILSTSTGWQLLRSASPEAVLSDRYAAAPAMTGGWSIDGNQIVIRPTLASGVSVAGVYQSNEIVRKADGSRTQVFSNDDDTFTLPERLLTLCMIWRWKANKGLPYGQDFDNFENALRNARANDGGREAITLATREAFAGVKTAWPWNIIP